MFTTGIEFRLKYGLDYGILMKYKHINTCFEIEKLLRYVFKDVEMNVMGVSKQLSLYQYFECKNVRLTANTY